MSRRLKVSVVVATLLAIATSTGYVLAGQKDYIPLEIDTTNPTYQFANAGMAETHNTANPYEFAECGSNSGAGFCTVRDAGGTYYSCYTTDPAQIAVIRSMSPDALISVVWDESAVCTYVLSYASSRAAPRVP